MNITLLFAVDKMQKKREKTPHKKRKKFPKLCKKYETKFFKTQKRKILFTEGIRCVNDTCF